MPATPVEIFVLKYTLGKELIDMLSKQMAAENKKNIYDKIAKRRDNRCSTV